MGWFNYYGLIIIVLIMVPNIAFAFCHKDGFENKYSNKLCEAFEQIGRYACFALMIFNIPYTYLGYYFPYAEVVYLAVNGALVLSYLLIWVIMWKKDNLLRAVLLSAIPSTIFVFSGIVVASIPLIVFSIIFAVTHILISVKNALA
ncbi:MAG: hypothetical protein ACI4QI_03665 [Candidatus Coproplasma sp.]